MTKGAHKIGGNTRKLTAVSQLQLGLIFQHWEAKYIAKTVR